MNRHGRAFIRLTLNRQPVLLAEEKTDPVVDIDEPDPGAVLMHMVRVGQYHRRRFLRHTGTIVRDANAYILSVAGGFHDNFTVAIHTLDTVVDRIFKNRLNDKLDGAALSHIVRQVEGKP